MRGPIAGLVTRVVVVIFYTVFLPLVNRPFVRITDSIFGGNARVFRWLLVLLLAFVVIPSIVYGVMRT